MALKRTFSGLRGIWNTDVSGQTDHDEIGRPVYEFLTPDVVRNHVRAYLQMLPVGEIVIGRDTRPSGENILEIAAEEIQKHGFNVIEVGIAPTPTVEIVTANTDAVGGIIVTASHNPIEYNGLKFLDNKGMFLKPEAVTRLLEICDNREWRDNRSIRGARTQFVRAVRMHVDRIFSLSFLEHGFAEGLKAICDANGGAGATVIPLLLKQGGASHICTGCNLDGVFLHPPVPTPENLIAIGKQVLEEGADIGLASDPDADRLALIDERGTPLSEELTLAIAVDFMLEMVKTPVVVNLSTSSLIEHIAQKHGVPVYRTPVGEINVSSKMFEVGSAIGGEGNGGVILPEVHPGRDAATGAALVMAAMGRWNKSLSEIVAAYPERYIVKAQNDLPGGHFSIDREGLLARLNPSSINEDDGLWLGFPDGFLHIRSSNTEPILRIIAESSTEEDAVQKINGAREFISM